MKLINKPNVLYNLLAVSSVCFSCQSLSMQKPSARESYKNCHYQNQPLCSFIIPRILPMHSSLCRPIHFLLDLGLGYWLAFQNGNARISVYDIYSCSLIWDDVFHPESASAIQKQFAPRWKGWWRILRYNNWFHLVHRKSESFWLWYWVSFIHELFQEVRFFVVEYTDLQGSKYDELHLITKLCCNSKDRYVSKP